MPFPIPETISDWVQAFGAPISGIIWGDKRTQPIIAYASPPYRSQKSLRPELVPILPTVSKEGNLGEGCRYPQKTTKPFGQFARKRDSNRRGGLDGSVGWKRFHITRITRMQTLQEYHSKHTNCHLRKQPIFATSPLVCPRNDL